jgi:cystathionine beta-lyase
VSLVVPYDLAAMRGPGKSGLRGKLVRFSLGFEAVADLQADIAQAMSVAFGPATGA